MYRKLYGEQLSINAQYLSFLKKGPFLMLKVISLSPARFWLARIDAQKLAGQLKCLHLHSDDQNVSLAERQRRKIKLTVMEP